MQNCLAPGCYLTGSKCTLRKFQSCVCDREGARSLSKPQHFAQRAAVGTCSVCLGAAAGCAAVAQLRKCISAGQLHALQTVRTQAEQAAVDMRDAQLCKNARQRQRLRWLNAGSVVQDVRPLAGSSWQRVLLPIRAGVCSVEVGAQEVASIFGLYALAVPKTSGCAGLLERMHQLGLVPHPKSEATCIC